MKPKHLLLAVVLIIASCKVKEKDIVGLYRLKSWDLTELKILKDHTFQYQTCDIEFFTKQKPLDSLHYIN